MTTQENIAQVRKIVSLIQELQKLLPKPGDRWKAPPLAFGNASLLTEDQKLALFQDSWASDAISFLMRWEIFESEAEKIEKGLREATQHFKAENETSAKNAHLSHQWYDNLSSETKVTVCYQHKGQQQEFVQCTLGTIPEGLPNTYLVKLGWPSTFVAPNSENSSKEARPDFKIRGE